MSEKKYPQVLRMVAETPWAILPSKLAAILDMVTLRSQGIELTQEEIQARIGDGPAHRSQETRGVVAVLPLYGVISPKADLMTEISGGTSVDAFAADFRSVMQDPDVKAVVLDIDSPGGSVSMISELASEIRSARGTKPIVAVANPMAASAAYWIGSQADEFVATESSLVGSVGVYGVHEDISGMQEQMGIKSTVISAGKHKADGLPLGPLSEDAEAHWQSLVDETYGRFVSDVAKGRGVSPAQVRDGFGEGRAVSASVALSEGMIDRIATFEETIAGIANPNGRSRVGTSAASSAVSVTFTDGALAGQTFTGTEAAASGLSFADEADELLRSLDAVVTRTETLRVLTGPKREQLVALIERANNVLTEHDPAKVLDEDFAYDAELALRDL